MDEIKVSTRLGNDTRFHKIVIFPLFYVLGALFHEIWADSFFDMGVMDRDKFEVLISVFC